MSPAFPLSSPPFPSYCCSSIASLSFPSHPSHSPLCPPLPFATHCLLLYFLFPISFPSLHLSTDFFPGENILPRDSVKTHCKKSPDSRHFYPLTKPLLQKGTHRTKPAWKYLFPVFFPLSGSEVLWLCQPQTFTLSFSTLHQARAFASLYLQVNWIFLYSKFWTTGWTLEIQTFKTPNFKTIVQQYCCGFKPISHLGADSLFKAPWWGWAISRKSKAQDLENLLPAETQGERTQGERWENAFFFPTLQSPAWSPHSPSHSPGAVGTGNSHTAVRGSKISFSIPQLFFFSDVQTSPSSTLPWLSTHLSNSLHNSCTLSLSLLC